MALILPYFLAFVAMCFYASLTPLSKKLTIDIPPFAFICITMMFLSVYGLIASFLIDKDFSLSKMEPTAWLSLAAFSLVNFIGFFLYLYALKNIPSTHYQLIYLGAPVVGGILAYFILQEEFKMQYLYSLPFIAVGLYIALKP